MKINLLRIIVFYSKRTLKYFLLQMLLIQAIMAAPSSSQGLEDYQVTLRANNQKLVRVLSHLEKQTDFVFAYNQEVAWDDSRVTLDMTSDLKTILQKLTEQVNFDFKRVNENIFVSRHKGIASSKLTDYLSNNELPGEEWAEIRGTVMDDNGQPIPGATVVVEGTNQGTVTDIDGHFSIDADEGEVILISFIGYQSQRITVANQTNLDVVLEEDQSDLEEVVVVGYGTQRKSDLTGAISSVSSEDLQETPAGNFLEQSQGRLAGVDIVRANGSPGSPVQIRIRGNRSINASNNPLYVIDGIPTSANISDFNPNDIESMEVLKDASAVAIYGSRGANGVVLITTKRGKTGKAVISYDGYYGVKQPIQDLNLMNGREFAAYSRISRGYDGDDPSFDSNFLAPLEIENLQAGRFTDWLDLAIQSGSQQDHQVSVSGGTDNINYYVSGSFFNEDGYIPGTNFERTSVRVNLESQLTDKLKLGLSGTVSLSERNQMSNAPYNNSLGYSPLVGPTDDEGNFLAFPNPREGLLANPLLNYQPFQYVDETRRNRIFANIFAEYQFNDHLKLRVNYGPDFNTARRGRYTGRLEGNINQGSVRNDLDFSYTQENILSYDRTFGKHALNLVGLFSIQASRFEESSLSGQDIPIEKSLFYDLGSSSTITGIGSSLGDWGLMSYMGRVNYRFDDKFLFTPDGSGRWFFPIGGRK